MHDIYTKAVSLKLASIKFWCIVSTAWVYLSIHVLLWVIWTGGSLDRPNNYCLTFKMQRPLCCQAIKIDWVSYNKHVSIVRASTVIDYSDPNFLYGIVKFQLVECRHFQIAMSILKNVQNSGHHKIKICS